MKKVIFVFAILISSMTLFAQDAKPKKTPEQRATMYVKELTTELSLTADQSSKIKAVQLESLTKLDTLKAKASAGDKKAGKKEAKALLMYAFTSEVTNSVKIPELRSKIARIIADKLGVNMGFDL